MSARAKTEAPVVTERHRKIAEATKAHYKLGADPEVTGAPGHERVVGGGLRLQVVTVRMYDFLVQAVDSEDVPLHEPRPIPFLRPDPAPEPVTGFDALAACRRLDAASEDLRRLASLWLGRVRSVATTSADEVSRLQGLAPRGSVDIAGRRISHDITLLQAARAAHEAIAYARETRASVASGRRLLEEVTAAHGEAATMLKAEQAATSGDLRHVRDPQLIGDLHSDLLSQYERRLEAVSLKLHRLDQVLREIEPLVPRLDAATSRHVGALAVVVAQDRVAAVADTLGKLAEMAKGLRVDSEPLKLMIEACEAVGCAAPSLTWPSDPLQPPSVA